MLNARDDAREAQFQYLGSRGAQHVAIDRGIDPIAVFQYLGSRGAQLRQSIPVFQHDGFNTWAREEPNVLMGLLATDGTVFQYLGSRGAQRLLSCLTS